MCSCCFTAHISEGCGRSAGKRAGGKTKKRTATGRAARPIGPKDIHQVPEGPGTQSGAGHATGGRDDCGREQDGRWHGGGRVGWKWSTKGVATGVEAAVRGPAGFELDGVQNGGGGGAEKDLEMGQGVGWWRRRRRERGLGGHVGDVGGDEPAEPRRNEGARFSRTSDRWKRAQSVSEVAKGAYDRGTVRGRSRWPAAGNDRRDGRTASWPGVGWRRWTGAGRGTTARAAAAAAAAVVSADQTPGRTVATTSAVSVHAAAAAARFGRTVQDRGPEGRL